MLWKEGRNILFNDALNTFRYDYIGVGHMVKNHIDGERGNPLPSFRGLLVSIDKKLYFYMHYSTDTVTHTTAFVVTGTGWNVKSPKRNVLWTL